jgi:hypothetical protein
MKKALAVFVVHSESACPERTAECRAEHERVVSELRASPASCVITDMTDVRPEASVTSGGSKPAVDRMEKHATAWALASSEGRAVLVMEDDVVLSDLRPAQKFVQSKLDCAALGGWSYAYMITAAAAEKLLSYFARNRRPASVTTELPAAIAAMCLSSTVYADSAVDGSCAGSHLPSVSAGKPHPGTSAVTSLDGARDLYESTGHPDAAITYVRLLQNAGYVIKAHDVCLETFDRVSARPDGRGTTPFMRTYVELFRGCPRDLRPHAAYSSL